MFEVKRVDFCLLFFVICTVFFKSDVREEIFVFTLTCFDWTLQATSEASSDVY